jgi:hypothetical protein
MKQALEFVWPLSLHFSRKGGLRQRLVRVES